MDIGSVSQYDYEVVRNECVAAQIHRLIVRSAVASELRPGQFMNLHVPGDGSHILRIPLSFRHADAQAGTVELLFAVVGEGTQRLAQMRPGDRSTLVGPCGHGWQLPEGPGRALLVAGGIGLPPIQACAEMLAAAGVGFDVVVGARTKAAHVYPDVDELAASGDDTGAGTTDPERVVVLTTDDGSLEAEEGHGRYATEAMAELLDERPYAQVYTCGPTVMMASVARLAQERGIACQASLERMMGCGFGACSCCNVTLVRGGYALCCQDGPVFDAREVVW